MFAFAFVAIAYWCWCMHALGTYHPGVCVLVYHWLQHATHVCVCVCYIENIFAKVYPHKYTRARINSDGCTTCAYDCFGECVRVCVRMYWCVVVVSHSKIMILCTHWYRVHLMHFVCMHFDESKNHVQMGCEIALLCLRFERSHQPQIAEKE